VNNSPSLAVKLALIIKTSSNKKAIIANPAKAPPIYNNGEGLSKLMLMFSKALISIKSICLKILKMKNGTVSNPIIILYSKMLI